MALPSARLLSGLAILGGIAMSAQAGDTVTASCLANGGFEADGGWAVAFRDGATGTNQGARSCWTSADRESCARAMG